jgi:hypothetical protein
MTAYTTGTGFARPGGAYILTLIPQTIPARKIKQVQRWGYGNASDIYRQLRNAKHGITTGFRQIYYTARSLLSEDVVKNGYTSYYNLNNISDIGVDLLGENIPVPFSTNQT